MPKLWVQSLHGPFIFKSWTPWYLWVTSNSEYSVIHLWFSYYSRWKALKSWNLYSPLLLVFLVSSSSLPHPIKSPIHMVGPSRPLHLMTTSRSEFLLSWVILLLQEMTRKEASISLLSLALYHKNVSITLIRTGRARNSGTTVWYSYLCVRKQYQNIFFQNFLLNLLMITFPILS